MPQHFVAIDVSNRAARIAVVESSLRTAELTQLETIDRSPGEETPAFFSRVKSRLPPGADSIIVNVTGHAVSTRLLTFPLTDLKKVESAIAFELENQLPHDLSYVATSFVVAPSSGSLTRVLTAAVSRTLVADTVDSFSAADMEPRAVVLPAASLLELVRSADADPVAVLSVGHEESHFAVIKKRNLLCVRSLRAGGQNVDQGLARHFNLTTEAARGAKETQGHVYVGTPPPAEAKPMNDVIVEALRPLTRLLVTTMRSLPADDQPQKLYLTGGMSRLAGLDRFLTQQLGVPVELLDVTPQIAPMTTKLPGIAPEYAVAIAMVLSLLRRGGATALNFRRGELAYRGDLQVYRGHIVRAVVSVAVLLVLGLVGSIVRYVLIAREEKALDAGFCKATQRIVGREICNPTAALATLKQSSVGGEGLQMPPYSASALFEMMSKSIDRSIDVQFDELEFRVEGRGGEADRIAGRGESGSFEATDQLVQKIKRDPCVQEAEISKQRKAASSGRVEFNISVKVKCPAGIVPGSVTTAAASSPQGAGVRNTKP